MRRLRPCSAHADWLSRRWAGREPGQPFTNFRAPLLPLKGQRWGSVAPPPGHRPSFYPALLRSPAREASPGAAQPRRGTRISGFCEQWELLDGFCFIWKGWIGAGWKRESGPTELPFLSPMHGRNNGGKGIPGCVERSFWARLCCPGQLQSWAVMLTS